MVVYIIFICYLGMNKRNAGYAAETEIRYRSAGWGPEQAETHKMWKGEEGTEELFFKSQISLAETC
jgi:hypothetical protein